jgi:hydroxymethylglutaryl-CoA reductase (NADPH)
MQATLPTALAALYAATGQDLANIGESNQCTVYQRMTREGDHYFSITLPSIIMASYGGGTNLPTQRECLGNDGLFWSRSSAQAL